MRELVETKLGRETESIEQIQEELKRAFKEIAYVESYEKGYISADFINQIIDPKLQGLAASLIAYDILEKDPDVDAIVGVPVSGVPLAVHVSILLGCKYLPGRKGTEIPGAWKDPLVIKGANSFTTSKKQETFIFNGLHMFKNIHYVDDFIAGGGTSYEISKALMEEGIGFKGVSLYVAKLYESGVTRMHEELGINPYYAIGVTDITEEEIYLADSNYSYPNQPTTPTP